MKTTNYNIRLNPVIKERAEKTFAEFGLNLSEAINVFLHMSIKSYGFPFEIREIFNDDNENVMLSDIYLNNTVTDENETSGDNDNNDSLIKYSVLKSSIEIAIENGQISTSLL